MNEKELAELRRRYRKDKSNITRVCGCFVNEKKEIISEFDQGLGLMPEEEAEQMLRMLKKVLSGHVGRNLAEVNFSTAQVMEGSEHLLLAQLRAEKLKNTETVHRLYEKIIGSYETDGNFLILAAHDTFDVCAYSADGERAESGEVFSYILCAVCPIKSAKPVLSYYVPGNCFRAIGADTMLCQPEVGFLFPAFDEQAANIYKAMYYTKDLTDRHPGVAEALFSAEPSLPMAPAHQKATFGAVLESAMEEDCSLKIVRSLHAQVCALNEAKKEEGAEEVAVVDRTVATEMLRACGVPEDRVKVFEEKYEEEFGADAKLLPKNLADSKQLQVKTPEVTVKVAPGCGDLVETRVIDGVRYILIRADHEVEVNGVNIQF